MKVVQITGEGSILRGGWRLSCYGGGGGGQGSHVDYFIRSSCYIFDM